MKPAKKLSMNQVIKAASKGDGKGFCLSCKAKVSGVEPDARKYVCPKCGAAKVYGAEELVIMFAF